jgi:hypothetical protein
VTVLAGSAVGTDTRVSTEGGGQPRFSADGGELFYVAAGDWMMAVPLRSIDGALEPSRQSGAHSG